MTLLTETIVSVSHYSSAPVSSMCCNEKIAAPTLSPDRLGRVEL
jgi:hypothetical protein